MLNFINDNPMNTVNTEKLALVEPLISKLNNLKTPNDAALKDQIDKVTEGKFFPYLL